MIRYWLPKWFGFRGITIWPFILFKKGDNPDREILNHEYIHLEQQKQMLVIPFYIWYIVEWLFKGYKEISFEREAYQNSKNDNYLHSRKFWAFIKYVL